MDCVNSQHWSKLNFEKNKRERVVFFMAEQQKIWKLNFWKKERDICKLFSYDIAVNKILKITLAFKKIRYEAAHYFILCISGCCREACYPFQLIWFICLFCFYKTYLSICATVYVYIICTQHTHL